MTGITDPSEEYFKDGLWGWASTVWEKLVSSSGLLHTGSHGWDGSAWQKLGMVWGFSSQYAEREYNHTHAAGTVALTFSTCPVGVVRVVLGLGAYNDGSISSAVYLYHNVSGANRRVWCKLLPPKNEVVGIPAPLILVNPDYLYVSFSGTDEDDNCDAFAWGYDMSLVG